MKLLSVIPAIRSKIGGETSVVAGTLVMQNGLRLLGSIIMTRLLTAEAFGIIAIITSVLVTFGLLSDIGITAFIMRHRGAEDPDFINELWTLRLIRSIVLTVAILVLSHPIAQFLGKDELQYAIALSSLTFAIDGLDSLGALLALRGRQIKRLSQLDLLTQAINLCSTILLACIIKSFWAILIGNMIGQCLRVWLSYYMFPGIRHRWRFSRARAVEMWRFSKFITGSTILTLIISQADKIILAKAFPLSVFGLYVVAAGLSAVPAGVAGAYGGRILLPRYGEVARYQPENLRQTYYDQRMNFHLLYAAGVGILAGCAPIVIEALYDPRYQSSSIYLQILLVGAFFSFGNAAANDIMIVSGHSFFPLATNIARIVYYSVAGLIGFRIGGAFGLILVVATIEMVAQIYAWFVLSKHNLLDLPKEFAIIALGLVGFGIGTLLNGILLWAVHAAGLNIA